MHEAIRDITDYLGGYYNYIRPHSFNGRISPAEYERQWEAAKNVSESSWPLHFSIQSFYPGSCVKLFLSKCWVNIFPVRCSASGRLLYTASLSVQWILKVKGDKKVSSLSNVFLAAIPKTGATLCFREGSRAYQSQRWFFLFPQTPLAHPFHR